VSCALTSEQERNTFRPFTRHFATAREVRLVVTPSSSVVAPAVDTVPGVLSVAMRPRVVRRALRYLVIVGTILISINHGDAILRGDVTTPRVLRMLLTCLVPYCVSTASSVEAVRALARDRLREQRARHAGAYQ